MKLATYLLLALLIFGVFSTHRTVRRSGTPAERATAIRVAAFTWLLGFLFLVAFIFLPNKQRALLMLPAFLAAVSLAKLWRNLRARSKRETDSRVDIERMKRVR
jgi:hypothetical protein